MILQTCESLDGMFSTRRERVKARMFTCGFLKCHVYSIIDPNKNGRLFLHQGSLTRGTKGAVIITKIL